MRFAHLIIRVFAATTLSACGGGGGGGSTPPPVVPAVPSFTLSTTTITEDKPVTSASPPTSLVHINLANIATTTTIYGSARYTPNVVSSLNLLGNGPSADLSIVLNTAAGLAPGIYQGYVELTLCLDAACAEKIAGSPATVNITYTVTRPTGPLAPRVSTATNPISVESLPHSVSPKSIRITLDHPNLSFGPVITTTKTSGVQSVGQAELNAVRTAFDVVLVAPKDIGIGPHVETITFRVCIDANCVNELEGSPLTVTVNYNVTNEVSLANGHTLRIVELDHNDSVWEPVSQKFYFLIPAIQINDPDMVGSYDPVTRVKSTPVPVGTNAHGLAVSDDGQFLYAGSWGLTAVKRFALPGLTPSLTIPLGNTQDNSTTLVPRIISVVPGASHTIVVGTSATNGVLDGDTLAVYDDDVRRATLLQRGPSYTDPFVEAMCWSPTGKLFGARVNAPGNPNTGNNAIYEMTLTSTGVQLDETTPGILIGTFSARRLHCAPTRVYSDDSFIFNPADKSIVRAFSDPLDNPPTITLDVAHNKLFAGVATVRQGSTFSLRSYNLNSIAVIDSLALPDELSSAFLQIKRWGPDGIAFEVPGNGVNTRAYGKYFVTITGPMIGP